MKFSVLLSVYEKEKANDLKESIESIINQTRKPNQIVIIKDGKLTQELEDIIQIYVREISKTNRAIWI